jgi:hypothetical protein
MEELIDPDPASVDLAKQIFRIAEKVAQVLGGIPWRQHLR